MKVYRSKVSGWILGPTISILAIASTLLLWNTIWVVAVFLLLMLVFVLYTLFNTYYTISGSQLLIKCGFLYNLSIDINKVKKITETNNPISSPASSLDRLEIAYGKWDRVLISPKNKASFIHDLQEINTAIEVKLKPIKPKR